MKNFRRILLLSIIMICFGMSTKALAYDLQYPDRFFTSAIPSDLATREIANEQNLTTNETNPDTGLVSVTTTKLINYTDGSAYEYSDTDIPFETETIEDPTLDKGVTVVEQEGVDGHIINEAYYFSPNNVPDGHFPYRNKFTNSIPKIIRVGTKQPVGSVIVHYVDQNGNKIKDDVADLTDVNTGTTYDTTDNKPTTITYNGQTYDYVSVNGAENGTVVEGTTEVTYIYKLKETTPTPDPTPNPTPTPSSSTTSKTTTPSSKPSSTQPSTKPETPKNLPSTGEAMKSIYVVIGLILVLVAGILVFKNKSRKK